MEQGKCVICNDAEYDGSDLLCIREKGSEGINVAAKKRGDNIVTEAGQFVHIKCRQKYISPYHIKKSLTENFNISKSGDFKPTLRSENQFDFATQCLFCGKVAKKDKKRSLDVYCVRSIDFQTSINQICNERNDEWSMDVKGRIESVNDLHAADAVYHQICSSNFRTKKPVPAIFSEDDIPAKTGRPSTADDHFQELVSYLENHTDDQVTINDLVNMMTNKCGDLAYSPKFLSRRLQDHFKDDIIITEKRGTAGVVTLRPAAKTILQDFYCRPKQNSDDEKSSIIKTAAKLIRSELMSMKVDKEYYPSTENMASMDDNFLYMPGSLRTLLVGLIGNTKDSLRASAIGQAIMKAVRPNSFMPPLQIGLAVHLHHLFGSRSLVESLFSLGFCSSYTEV